MFRQPVTGWSLQHVPDQRGRRIAITGATSGIGLETARILASAGAHVVMAVRNVPKGLDLARSMAGEVDVRLLDTASLDSVRAFAAEVGPLDVLINNAGVMGVPEEHTSDGFEMQLATNHLGHFALTNLLLPQITDRVVIVGSESHRAGRIDLDDLNYRRRAYHPYEAYCQSKLANLLFLAELQRRLTAAGSTLRAVGAHPGYSSTGIQSHTGSRIFTALAQVGNRFIGMPSLRGALPTVFVATMDVPGNTYVGPHGPGELRGSPVPVGRSELAANPDLAKALWLESERLTGVGFALRPHAVGD